MIVGEEYGRPGMVLTKEGEELYLQFLDDYGDRGCTCFINPPCGFCTHEGNPLCLAEGDDLWEKAGD